MTRNRESNVVFAVHTPGLAGDDRIERTSIAGKQITATFMDGTITIVHSGDSYEVAQYDDGRLDCPKCERNTVYESRRGLKIHMSKAHDGPNHETRTCWHCNDDFAVGADRDAQFCSWLCYQSHRRGLPSSDTAHEGLVVEQSSEPANGQHKQTRRRVIKESLING